MALIVVFRRTTGAQALSDYDVSIRINDREIEHAEVHGHRRTDGWRALLAQFLDENPAPMMVDQNGTRRPIPDGAIEREDGRIERICEHGVGHPIGHRIRWERWMGVHGCCGGQQCCGDEPVS